MGDIGREGILLLLLLLIIIIHHHVSIFSVIPSFPELPLKRFCTAPPPTFPISSLLTFTAATYQLPISSALSPQPSGHHNTHLNGREGSCQVLISPSLGIIIFLPLSFLSSPRGPLQISPCLHDALYDVYPHFVSSRTNHQHFAIPTSVSDHDVLVCLLGEIPRAHFNNEMIIRWWFHVEVAT